MDRDTKAMIAFVAIAITVLSMAFGTAVYLVRSDMQYTQEMASQGYVWVPATPGHFEKKQ